MSDTDFDEQLGELKSNLRETIVLLREHDERHWLLWAERCQRELDARDAAAIDHILGAYGGMGSFNDLLILGWNGHRVEPEEEDAMNRRLGHLRSVIWTRASAIRHEIR